VGGNVTAQQLISTSNTEVGDRLKFSGSNVFVDTLRVADVAANIVTYDRTTGELLDSSGTFMNKFAVVSEQPPSDLFANATTVANHGGYTLTTSNLATNSNTFNAFDGTANAWTGGTGMYIGGSNVLIETNLTQLSNLHPTQRGDWLAIEFPYKTTLRHMKLTPATVWQSFPYAANLYATNNDLTWTEIGYWDGLNPGSASNVQTITVNATEQFKKYALVTTKLVPQSTSVASAVSLQDWQLFTESFSIDGGKVAMAQQPTTGGETVMDQHGPHGRLPKAVPLKKYPEIAFEDGKFDSNDSTNTYVQAGYTVTANSTHENRNHEPWKIFDGSQGTEWQISATQGDRYSESTGTYNTGVDLAGVTVADQTYNGDWVQVSLPRKIKVDHMNLATPATYGDSRMPEQGVLLGSNNGSSWSNVASFGQVSYPDGLFTRISINSAEYYSYYRMIWLTVTAGDDSTHRDRAALSEWELYGYEEDPPFLGDTSVDTTFKSIMNTPQTTGAQVYVDGSLGETFTNRVVGPTVSNTHTTYVSAEKYWELSGNVESNVTLEANTFLSGDAPHSLSMWFNSSNLVSNASNSCIFSLGTEERLDHVSAAFSDNYQTVQKLVASDAEGNDRFGKDVAMNSDGTKVIVGAYLEHAGGTSDAGSVYIYTYNGVSWVEHKLVSPDNEAQSQFGGSVSMSSDGMKVIVGAMHDDEGVSDTGAAYIFTYSGGSWDAGTKIVAPDKAQDDRFGSSVGMSGNGTKVIVGAYIEDHNVAGGAELASAGSAYIYTYDGSNWDTGTKIVASDRAASDLFGRSVAMNSDGTKAIVGASGNDGVGGEAAYIFTYNGSSWVQQQILVASDGAEDDKFGFDVAMNSSGTKVIVGAHLNHAGSLSDAGAAYIYTYNGSSWDTGTKIVAPDKEAADRFGFSVGMSSDGTRVIVGAYLEHAGVLIDTGSAYIYTYDGSNWDTGTKISAPVGDRTANDQFGTSVAMNSDGKKVIVGGQLADPQSLSSAGFAHVFTRDTTHHLTTDLKLQSNTWHNLTYAYQGEGGSRVTYLDGRKVAEDQAEDTFGEYPPFAIRNYSYGEYYVSSSSEYGQAAGFGGTYPPWDAFDDLTGTNDYWSGGGGAAHTTALYNTSSPFNFTGYGHPYETSVSGTTYTGDWIQLEMPHKLVLNYSNIKSGGTATTRFPRQGVFAGSNDGVNWDAIHTFSGLNGGTAETSIVTNSENNTEGYKYIRLIITHLNGQGYAGISTLKFYGHRENDLVRLPDPTNVLKYPRRAITASHSAGDNRYINRFEEVSTTSEFSTNGGTYSLMKAFDNIDGTSSTYWSASKRNSISGNLGRYASGAHGAYNGETPTGKSFIPSGATTVQKGEWIKMKSHHKLKLNKIELLALGTDHKLVPSGVLIWGSDDDSNWTLLKTHVPSGTGGAVTYSSRLGVITVNSTVAYKYHAMVMTHMNNSDSNYTLMSISQMKFYGTEEATSIPIQIGGGNIDKVANFRVYDKFVGEDQALEIWDAQKDEFGRAKSSMTLHKGRLGIGTTEPEGRLAVLDEPHNLEEFPPRAMSGHKTYFEGHGEFCASATTEYSGNWAYEAFDKVTSESVNHWSQDDPSHYDSTTGEYTGPSDYFTNVEGQVALGHWLQIEFPYKIKYSYSTIQGPFHAAGRQPHTGYIVGSNDLSGTWTSLHNFKNMKRIGSPDSRRNSRDFLTYTPPTVTTQTFKYFRLVIEKMGGGNTHAGVDQWNIFGTREQGQSVLHDGQLTLTKNLNVPRIGPDLDADYTPRRDRLVVEYNTSTNQPTGVDDAFGGVVRDTSGRGNDGVYYRRAAAGAGITGGYNADEKAFEFNTQNTPEQHIQTRINNHSGDYIHSASVWFKTNKNTATISTNEETLFQIGNDFANGVNPYVSFYGNLLYYAWHSHNIYCATTDINQLGWNHVCVTYTGGGSSLTTRKIYLNGKVQSATLVGTSGVLLNLPEDTFVTLGAKKRPTDTLHYLDGFLSDFKLYDIALTASEAKTLYDMGRCDEGHHTVNFSKTRVGIGLGDGEAPRAALDVSGGMSRGTFTISQLNQNWWQSGGAGLRLLQYGTGDHWDISVASPTDDNLAFGYNGASRGYFRWNGTNVNQNFTGQHRTFIKNVPFSQAGDLEGLVVSSDQNKYIKMSGGIEAGSNAITTNESLPIVSLSNAVTDKKCFGVISASEDPEQREDEYGSFVSVAEKEKGDTRVYINSVGEGAIWVVNTNGSLESGDYITTSNVAGYGQKQESDSLKNYTVAKITMDCDFNPATQPIQQILRSNVIQTYYLGNVHKVKSVPHEFVTTTVGADDTWSNVSVSPSDVTYAEWSNLEANTQNTYTLTYTQTSNVVYDTKYTLTTTANVTESDPWDSVFVDPPDVTYAEYSNLEANTQSSYSLTFTKTTTDEKTPEEWSSLESNTQSLYNKVYYQSVEEEVASDYPGAVAHTRVTDVIENELDAHGQIQWEDHATETEKAYKIRYLDVSGAQTDSANAVHIAAFVGCTYHCG